MRLLRAHLLSRTRSIKPTTPPSCLTDVFNQRIQRNRQQHEISVYPGADGTITQRTAGLSDHPGNFIPATDHRKLSRPCQIRKECYLKRDKHTCQLRLHTLKPHIATERLRALKIDAISLNFSHSPEWWRSGLIATMGKSAGKKFWYYSPTSIAQGFTG